jgi:hypothetical protein
MTKTDPGAELSGLLQRCIDTKDTKDTETRT